MSRLLALYREAFRGLSREVWILALAFFVNRCGTMVLPFLVLYLTREQGYGMVEAGRVLTFYGIGSIGGIWAGGWLSDRIGFHAVMRSSLALSAVGFVAIGYVEGRLWIGVTAVVLGFVAEAFRPANGAAVAAYSRPEERTRAFGLNRLAINLGWTVGPALGGFLALQDYRLLFWADGITCMSAAAILTLLLSGEPDRAGDAEEKTEPRRSPWRDGHFLVVFAMLMLQGLVFFQVQSTYTLFLSEEGGLRENVIGLLLAVNTVVIVLVEMPLVKRIEHRDPLKLMAVASLFVGAGFGLMVLGTHVAWLALLVVVWTIGEMLNAPTSLAWVANRADAASRGAYMGAFGIAFSCCHAAAPWIGTEVYERYGSDALWLGCLGTGLIAALGFRLLAAAERS